MGAAAGLLAMPTGLALAWVLIFIINRRSFGWTMQLQVEPHILLQALALAIGAALAGGRLSCLADGADGGGGRAAGGMKLEAGNWMSCTEDCSEAISRITHHVSRLVTWRIACGRTSRWLLWPKTPQPLRARLVAEAAPADTMGFSRAEGPVPLAFPADHGPHDDFQTEWWYYTGNLKAETGEHFGYQLTFFRRALAPPDQRTRRDSVWAADQVYMAHLALTDVSGGKHYSFEKLARGAAGLAGAQAEPFRVWLEDWSVAAADGAGRGLKSTSDTAKSAEADWGAGGPVRLRAAAHDPASGHSLSLDLNLADRKGPILQGDQGYSRKGPEPGNASYYVSQPRITTVGTVTVGREVFTVDGLSWMDHEWSTSALGADQVGWDWFSIQLDGNTELMLFQLRRADGRVDAFSSGTLIAADGSTRQLGPGDFSIQSNGRWRSPRTGGEYPAAWRVTVPSADLVLSISPWLADQEMDVSQKYWEGRGEGGGDAQRATGRGQRVCGVDRVRGKHAGAVLIGDVESCTCLTIADYRIIILWRTMKSSEFDLTFDDNVSVPHMLDLASARKLNLAQKRVTMDFPIWMIESLDRTARRMGVTRQSVIKMWLAERLEREEAAAKV